MLITSNANVVSPPRTTPEEISPALEATGRVLEDFSSAKKAAAQMSYTHLENVKCLWQNFSGLKLFWSFSWM